MVDSSGQDSVSSHRLGVMVTLTHACASAPARSAPVGSQDKVDILRAAVHVMLSRLSDTCAVRDAGKNAQALNCSSQEPSPCK